MKIFQKKSNKEVLKKAGRFFKGQRENENVIMLLHRHTGALFLRIFKPLVIVVAAITILLKYAYDNQWLFIIPFGLLIFSLLWIAYEWLCWWLDIYIITDQRVIDINQRSLFSKRVSEASWDKMQDVTYEVKGILPTLLNYGSVMIQTASATSMIHFEQVGAPEKIQDLITQVQKNPQAFTELFLEKKTGFKQKEVEDNSKE